jgi:metallo-beta-lactamase family protein
MGRRLADREPQVNIFGEVYTRKCDVATIGGLSGHAGQDLLVKYAMGVKDSVKQIFLVHGEEKQAMTLKGLLHEQNLSQVHYPELHESVDV